MTTRTAQAPGRRGSRWLLAVLTAVATLAALLGTPSAGAGAEAAPSDSTLTPSGGVSVPASTLPRLPLTSLPEHGSMAVDPVRGLVAVGETDRVEVFTFGGGLVGTVAVSGPGPLAVVGDRLFVSEFQGTIAVVDLNSVQLVARITPGLGNVWSLVGKDGLLYVGCSGPGIATVDPATLVVTAVSVPVVDGVPLHDPILLPGEGPGALVAVEFAGRVVALQVTGAAAVETGVYTPAVPTPVDSAALEPGGARVWMTRGGQPTFSVELGDMTAGGSFDAGAVETGTGSVLAVRGGSRPLVATLASGQVRYNETTSPWAPAGSDPLVGVVRSMAFSPDGQQLFVAGVENPSGPVAPYLQIVFPDGTPGGGFHPLPGTRLLDTRTGVGAPLAPLGSGQALDLQVTGRASIPLTGVDSVVLNMTVTEPTGAGFLTTYPAGLDRPTASSMNFVPGQTVANLVTVPVGAGGKVTVFNSFGSTHVVADVAGWYDQTGEGATYHPLAPGRVLDTRDGTNTTPEPVGAGAERTVTVAGLMGVPPSGASAVVLNLTATGPTADTYVTAWPTGQDRPLASNLNLPTGDTRPNLVVVPLGTDGSVSLYNHAGSIALVADVVGWFGDQASNGSTFVAVGPVRLADSRAVGGAIGPDRSSPLMVGTWLPSDTTAVVLNVTVVDGTEPGWLVVYPSGIAPPLASNLNWSPGQVNPNQVVVPVGSNGAIEFYNHNGWVDVVVDLAGIYVG